MKKKTIPNVNTFTASALEENLVTVLYELYTARTEDTSCFIFSRKNKQIHSR